MKIFNLQEWKPLDDVIKHSRDVIRNVMNKHFNESIHNEVRKVEEVRFFLKNFRFITRKWNVEILYELEIHKGLTFNDLIRHLQKISSRTLSDCLKQLQNFELITRTVKDTRPPTVLYELSEKGKGFIELSILIIYHLADVENSD